VRPSSPSVRLYSPSEQTGSHPLPKKLDPGGKLLEQSLPLTSNVVLAHFKSQNCHLQMPPFPEPQITRLAQEDDNITMMVNMGKAIEFWVAQHQTPLWYGLDQMDGNNASRSRVILLAHRHYHCVAIVSSLSTVGFPLSLLVGTHDDVQGETIGKRSESIGWSLWQSSEPVFKRRCVLNSTTSCETDQSLIALLCYVSQNNDTAKARKELSCLKSRVGCFLFRRFVCLSSC
jgi:hypothetical protein